MTLPRLEGRSILILEEDEFLSGYIASVLEDCGAEIVGPFTCLQEARAELGVRNLSASVLDVHAAGALELAGAMQGQGLPLVFVSARPAAQVPAHYESVLLFSRPFAGHQIANALSDLFACPAEAGRLGASGQG